MHYGHRRIGNEKCDRIWIGENLSYMGEKGHSTLGILFQSIVLPYMHRRLISLKDIFSMMQYFLTNPMSIATKNAPENSTCQLRTTRGIVSHVTMNFKSITA